MAMTMEDIALEIRVKDYVEKAANYSQQLMQNESLQGQSIQTILTQIYCDRLEGKTPAQGAIIADAVIQSVSEFQDTVEEICENREGYVENLLTEMTCEKSLEEQYLTFTKLTAYITALSSDDVKERQKVIDDIKSLSDVNFSDLQITQADVDAWRENAKQSLLQNQILAAQAAKLSYGGYSLSGFVDAAEDNQKIRDFLAVSSMLFYTDIMNGTIKIDGLPDDITVEQTTQLVCSAAAFNGFPIIKTVVGITSFVLLTAVGILLTKEFIAAIVAVPLIAGVVALSQSFLWLPITLLLAASSVWIAASFYRELIEVSSEIAIPIANIANDLAQKLVVVGCDVLPKVKAFFSNVAQKIREAVTAIKARVFNKQDVTIEQNTVVSG